ncbi:nitroreductase family protein [Herbaspirillum sp. RTI4]|uniref:nitroreductase family protein n=1 Tax=Herbaspirillum sp. RTI4 TaxID=3048640 RepID=UPI002AB45068|nr:nitroreductase family protein [Herbaspirillum sp. RTI4]MDY7576961.1 nitroreductase family protein [Herbaspirillum sp. RTI4]MEA9982137.1 nitroreductase family protein [Herbaspirillum sp. RTI4]
MPQANPRVADYPVDPQFLNRWSPRAFTGEDISEATVNTFLEAARWAPSSYNSQPWRFVYARKGTAHWDSLLGLLNEFNQSWAKSGSVLFVVISKDNFVPPGGKDEVPAVAHTFDAGSAWSYLALQASLSGWQAHAMIGFDKDKARTVLGIPDGYTVEAAVVVGKEGDKTTLPEGLQGRESPSPRLPVSSFAFEGIFKA